jgi:hypothetical protein
MQVEIKAYNGTFISFIPGQGKSRTIEALLKVKVKSS